MYSLIDPVYLTGATLRRARLHEALGERDEAIRDYRTFVAMWADCDEQQRPALKLAQARLARLLGE